MVKKRGLGRGLDALLSNTQALSEQLEEANTESANQRELPVDLIQRGKYQPRKDMDPVALEELAESIKTQGIMQPIVVRPISESKYEIIAGERRWRATQLAGLDTIPVLIRDVPDNAAIAMSLIENIQRENLNAIEEAVALQRLQQEFDLTHQEVADAVGKSRATISNLLRLMALRPEVRLMLEHGDIDAGHAKALLALPEDMQLSAAKAVTGKGLSVRQTENLVRGLQQKSPKKDKGEKTDSDVLRLENDLSERLGAPVAIQSNAKGKGKLVIRYSNLDQLDGILKHIQ